jgi:hypothetical protein
MGSSVCISLYSHPCLAQRAEGKIRDRGQEENERGDKSCISIPVASAARAVRRIGWHVMKVADPSNPLIFFWGFGLPSPVTMLAYGSTKNTRWCAAPDCFAAAVYPRCFHMLHPPAACFRGRRPSRRCWELHRAAALEAGCCAEELARACGPADGPLTDEFSHAGAAAGGPLAGELARMLGWPRRHHRSVGRSLRRGRGPPLPAGRALARRGTAIGARLWGHDNTLHDGKRGRVRFGSLGAASRRSKFDQLRMRPCGYPSLAVHH